MPFGPEAKAMLQRLVENQPLRILVYNVDMYGRLVADVYSKKGFIQVRALLLHQILLFSNSRIIMVVIFHDGFDCS